MSLERRNLQNLIHKFDISGKWPMNQYSKTLAQTIIGAGYRHVVVDDAMVERFNEAFDNDPSIDWSHSVRAGLASALGDTDR